MRFFPSLSFNKALKKQIPKHFNPACQVACPERRYGYNTVTAISAGCRVCHVLFSCVSPPLPTMKKCPRSIS